MKPTYTHLLISGLRSIKTDGDLPAIGERSITLIEYGAEGAGYRNVGEDTANNENRGDPLHRRS